ncbi:MAG: hypothetical protein R3274_12490, partial [Desulfobacterales bacterium]|nr:hypothetical protein [Desulfobacterales bacterium]
MRIRLLEQVRAGCRTVAERAAHVRINYDFIPAYAAALPAVSTIRPEHDRTCHYLDRGDDTAAFFLTLDTINFGSGYFPLLNKQPGRSGYFTIAGRLNDRFREKGPLSPRQLARLTPENCA